MTIFVLLVHCLLVQLCNALELLQQYCNIKWPANERLFIGTNKMITTITLQTTDKSLKHTVLSQILNQAQSEYKHSLAFCVWRYDVIATKPMHRLQIRPMVHNYWHPYHSPKLRPGLYSSSVRMQRGTDRHTDGRDQDISPPLHLV